MSSPMTEKDLEAGKTPLRSRAEANSNDDSGRHIYLWTTVNVVATAAIVHINKAILSDSPFSHCHSGFISFHFAVSSVVLYFSRLLSPKTFTHVKIPLTSIILLSVVMCANVILVNLSLSSSSIVFYQIVRVLLTPLTALLNLFLYHSKLPFAAVISLLPVCVGVGLVTYPSVSHPATDPTTLFKDSNTYLGIITAFSGVICSSLYTVWVAHFHTRMKISSIQLLYTQLPLCAIWIGIISIFTDNFPIWRTVASRHWGLLFLSGVCACVINLSSYIIIRGAGPVSSTVIGQLKTCLIVGLSWATNPSNMGTESVIGVLLTLSGMILYSVAIRKEGAR